MSVARVTAQEAPIYYYYYLLLLRESTESFRVLLRLETL